MLKRSDLYFAVLSNSLISIIFSLFCEVDPSVEENWTLLSFWNFFESAWIHLIFLSCRSFYEKLFLRWLYFLPLSYSFLCHVWSCILSSSSAYRYLFLQSWVVLKVNLQQVPFPEKLHHYSSLQFEICIQL